MSKQPIEGDPVTVVELNVEAFQRIRAAHVRPNATGVVLVRGENGQGKSSLIGSMLEALGVERSKLPITEGEHAGGIRLDLGELVIEEKLTRTASGEPKRGLSIVGRDGGKLSSPASVLKELRSHFADPVEFERMEPAEQVKVALRVLGLADELEALEGQEAAAYDERRDLGREADRAGKAALEAADALLGVPEPPPPGALQAAAEDLRVAEEQRAARDAGLRAMSEIQRRGTETTARVAELERELVVAREKLEAGRREWLASKAAYDALPIPGDVQTLRARLDELEAAAQTAGKVELARQLGATAREAKASHELAERRLAECRRKIDVLLGGAKFPVEGMTYNREKKTLAINGIPFAQASQAERLRSAAGIAMAGEPKIKVLFVREGSLLDRKSRELLDTIARANGFQIWIEVVESKPDACARAGCGLPRSVHGHGETGREDSHPFEEPAATGAGVWIEDGTAFQPEP